VSTSSDRPSPSSSLSEQGPPAARPAPLSSCAVSDATVFAAGFAPRIRSAALSAACFSRASRSHSRRRRIVSNFRTKVWMRWSAVPRSARSFSIYARKSATSGSRLYRKFSHTRLKLLMNKSSGHFAIRAASIISSGSPGSAKPRLVASDWSAARTLAASPGSISRLAVSSASGRAASISAGTSGQWTRGSSAHETLQARARPAGVECREIDRPFVVSADAESFPLSARSASESFPVLQPIVNSAGL
jgi:hypothetical protein